MESCSTRLIDSDSLGSELLRVAMKISLPSQGTWTDFLVPTKEDDMEGAREDELKERPPGGGSENLDG